MAEVPTYAFHPQQVEDAYQAMAALKRLLRDEPALRENEHFKALVDTASARFQLAFERLV